MWLHLSRMCEHVITLKFFKGTRCRGCTPSLLSPDGNVLSIIIVIIIIIIIIIIDIAHVAFDEDTIATLPLWGHEKALFMNHDLS
jgi:hypothetical protein